MTCSSSGLAVPPTTYPGGLFDGSFDPCQAITVQELQTALGFAVAAGSHQPYDTCQWARGKTLADLQIAKYLGVKYFFTKKFKHAFAKTGTRLTAVRIPGASIAAFVASGGYERIDADYPGGSLEISVNRRIPVAALEKVLTIVTDPSLSAGPEASTPITLLTPAAVGNGHAGQAEPLVANVGTISADGRYVIFDAPDDGVLIPPAKQIPSRMFLVDTNTRTFTHPDTNAFGVGPNQISGQSPQISDDDRYIAWASAGTNIVPGCFGCGFDNIYEIYVKDRTTGQIAYASVGSDGHPCTDVDADLAMSSEGSITFIGDCNGTFGIFERNPRTNTTRFVASVPFDPQGLQLGMTVAHDGTLSLTGDFHVWLITPNGTSTEIGDDENETGFPHLSNDGRLLLYEEHSAAPNTITERVMLLDRTQNTTREVFARNCSGDSELSRNGTVLLNQDCNGVLTETTLASGRTSVVAFTKACRPFASNTELDARMSNDGRYVALFSSSPQDLDSDRTVVGGGIYLRDMTKPCAPN